MTFKFLENSVTIGFLIIIIIIVIYIAPLTVQAQRHFTIKAAIKRHIIWTVNT